MSDELNYIDNFDGSPERPSMIDNPFVKGNNWLRFIEEEKQITLGEEQLQVLHDIVDIILDLFAILLRISVPMFTKYTHL